MEFVVTAYLFAANVVCLEACLAIGNALAAAIDPDTGGAQTFDKGLRCYPAGTTFTGIGPSRVASASPTARASFPLLTADGYAKVAEFAGPGPYTALNAIGITDEMIAAAKAIPPGESAPAIRLEVGPRAEIEPHGIAYVQSLGYVV